MRIYKHILTLSLALSLPTICGFAGFDDYQEDIQVTIRRSRKAKPKQPTGTELAQQLVEGVKQTPKKQKRAVNLATKENAEVISSVDLNNTTFTALEERINVDASYFDADEAATTEQVQVPTIVAMQKGATIWTTSGQPATFVEHIALQVAADDNLIATLCVHGTNDNPFYTFGDKTFVMPESDVDAVILFVKIDSRTGNTLAMEAHPARSLQTPEG